MSLDLLAAVRVKRVASDSFELDRAFRWRLVAPAGVAIGDASDRLLHSETVPTRALVLRRFPARRPAVRCLAAPSDGHPRTGAFRLRARSRERLFSRAASPVRRRALQVPGSSGPPDTERGRGESRFTARLSLRRPDDSHAAAFSSAVWSRYRPPLTPLSPPPRRLRGSRFFDPLPATRRPPRPVPRMPRERRALRRPRVPSTDSRRAHPARAEARTKPRCLHRRRGAHVMRIAELHDDPPPFCLRWAPALARLSDLRWSGSRSRAPGNDQAFDPTETGGALL